MSQAAGSQSAHYSSNRQATNVRNNASGHRWNIITHTFWSGETNQETSDLDLRQVVDLWEDSDVIGVSYERVQPLTAGHGGRDGLQLVAA